LNAEGEYGRYKSTAAGRKIGGYIHRINTQRRGNVLRSKTFLGRKKLKLGGGPRKRQKGKRGWSIQGALGGQKKKKGDMSKQQLKVKKKEKNFAVGDKAKNST